LKIIRFLPWWIIVLVSCVFLAWHYRVDIVTSGINLLLKDSDIQKLEYGLESIGFSQASIPRLDLELVINDQIHVISAQQLELRYTVERLYEGIIESIHIEKLQVDTRSTVSRNVNSLEASFEISTIVGLLVSITRQSIPANRIVIDELAVLNNGFSVTPDHPATLVIVADPVATAFQFGLDESALKVDIRENSVSIALADGDEETILSGKISVPGEITESPANVSGEFEYKSENLIAWLSAHFELELPEIRGNAVFSLDGKKHPEQDQWKLQITGSISEFKADFTDIPHAEFDLNLMVPEVLDVDNISIFIKPGSRVVMDRITFDDMEVVSLIFTPSGEAGIRDNAYYASLDKNTFLSFDSMAYPELSLDKARLSLAANISFPDFQTVLELGPGTSLSAGQLGIQDTGFNDIRVNLMTHSHLKFSKEPENSSWIVEGGNWLVSDILLPLDELNARTDTIELDLHELSTDFMSMNFNTAGISVDIEPLNVALEPVSGSIHLDGIDLMINGKFGLREFTPVFTYTAEINIEQESGHYSIAQHESIDISSNSTPLNTLLSHWAPDLHLDQGNFSVNATGHWQKSTDVQSEFQLEFTDAGGFYSDIGFTGLSLTGPVFLPPIEQSGSASINIRQLEYGIEVNNIESEFSLSGFDNGELRGLSVSKLSGEILGSRFEGSEFVYDITAPKNHIELSLTGLDIGKLVDIQQFEGLNATGKLDGTLPVDILPEGISIESGQFWSHQEGGTINYRIDPEQAESLSNPLTDTVIQALEEFHYDLLTASAKYEPDGDLTINFHIEGKSPSLDSERPVHLNINSEQNVISLLESLKYSEDLNSKLDDNIRKKVLSTE
jgi:hypothetical protein